MIDQGILAPWNAHYVKFDGNRIIERRNWQEEAPRFRGIPGMNAVAHYLAVGLNVCLNTKIVSLWHEGQWQLGDDRGVSYPGFDWVISTAPAPQTAALLPASFIHHRAIQEIEMQPCFALMLGFAKSLPLAFEVAQVIHSDLSWMAARSADRFTFMVHSSAAYAAAHMAADHDQVMQHLMAEVTKVIGHEVSLAEEKILHGWRYANHASSEAVGLMLVDHANKLAACGDWCAGGRVEGAFTSAYNLTVKLKEGFL
jgi:renalase